MDQLPRRLGLIDASLIVIGVVIGSGIFLLPNVIARSLPSGPAMLAVWVVAGVLSYFDSPRPATAVLACSAFFSFSDAAVSASVVVDR